MKKSGLPTEYKKGIGARVKEFFSKLFGSKKVSIDTVEIVDGNESIEEVSMLRENLKEKLSDNIDSVSSLSNDRLIEEYRKNPDILDSLSVEKLKELSAYYDELIAKCDEKLSSAS